MQGRIFISYRRADSQYATDRIYERLAEVFGEGCVFMDIDDIPLGVNFRDYIDQQVSTSSIVLAVIGDHWLDALDAEGKRRLENPSDFVRLELEAALRQSIKLIPVFIGDVQAIQASKLPKSMQELPMLNATRIRRGQDFLPDVDRLIRGIQKISQEQDTLRERNKAALAELKQSAAEIKRQLSQFEALMIQEMRKRTQLEKQAQKIEAQVEGSLLDPGKTLQVDVEAVQQEIEKLNEGLYELALQVEARKQGRVIEEDLFPEVEEPAVEPVSIKPKPERKPRQPKAAKPKPEIGKALAKVPIWVWGAAAVVIIGVVLGVILGPDLYQRISTSLAESSSPTLSTEVEDASTGDQDQQSSQDELAVNPMVINWIDQIKSTTPDFIEDFSIPQARWYHDYYGLGLSSHDGGVTEGVLQIVKDTEDIVEIRVGSYPFGSDALLQFEFTPLMFEQEAALWISFPENSYIGVSLLFQMDGTWELFTYERNLRTVIARGNINPLEFNQTYIFEIFTYHGSTVVRLDHQTFIYEVDQAIPAVDATIAFIHKGAFEGNLDNIQVWDLTEIALYDDVSASHDVRAKDFYSPIREFLAATPPTNEDDFEAYREYWEEMQVNFSDTKPVELAALVQDGEVRLNSVDDLEYGNFELNFPELTRQTHSSFAIQYDFRFNEPGSSNLSTSVDTSWGPEDNQEHYSAYCDFYQDSQEIFCGLYELNDSGKFLEVYNRNLSFYKDMDQAFTFLAIFYQDQFALFLDGYFMGYVDSLEHIEQTIAINFGKQNPDDEFQARFDNIKYWDLSNFVTFFNDYLPSDPDQVSHFAYQLLSYTNTQPPDFEEDFETPQAYWNEMRLDSSENNPVYLSAVVTEGPGAHAFIDSRAEFLESHDVAFNFEQVRAESFAFEFDFNFNSSGMQESDQLAVLFSQAIASDQEHSKEYHFLISPSQEDKFAWWIESWPGEHGTDYDVIASGIIEAPEFLNSAHKLSVFVRDDQLLALYDHKVVAFYSGLDLTTAGVLVDIYFDQPGLTMDFDDVRFWNLDGVNLEYLSN
ncbi:MAG: TIR domain-containing protein [Anaerolineales bacterium]|nr:TIR domain-containing protein [Anaerolineales bacterium]